MYKRQLYAFLARMGPLVLACGEDHLVCADDDGRVTVLAWQPVGGTAAPDVPDRHEVRVSVPVVGTRAFVRRERVNEHDGNAFAAWRELGRPDSPDTRTFDLLRDCARPAVEHRSLAVDGGRVELVLPLARHEITFVEVRPVRPQEHTGLDDRRLLGGSDDRLVAEHER